MLGGLEISLAALLIPMVAAALSTSQVGTQAQQTASTAENRHLKDQVAGLGELAAENRHLKDQVAGLGELAAENRHLKDQVAGLGELVARPEVRLSTFVRENRVPCLVAGCVVGCAVAYLCLRRSKTGVSPVIPPARAPQCEPMWELMGPTFSALCSAPRTMGEHQLTADSPEHRCIARAFLGTAHNCTVTGIWLINQRPSCAIFCSNLEKVHEVRATRAARCPSNKFLNDEQRAVLQFLLRQSRPPPDDSMSTVHVVPTWFGCNSFDTAKSISRSGFIHNERQTDDGYFGHGIYSALEPHYAAYYATKDSASGKQVVFLCAAAFGAAYPVTGRDYRGSPYEVKSRFNGKPLESRYDAHFVPVKNYKTHTTYQACDLSKAEYHELVVGESTQICPLARIEFECNHRKPPGRGDFPLPMVSK
eukprot:TRINITY_DN2321_c0_g1_i1.p1 TRINITY_DN2321_c0_g1~~TRINITY_DN2321_c0_g1_i1.p1  ORF type:complete len:421 (-),score=62.02 TRINITY_DN2321_c0_g1_i1:154-1416(-)